MVVIKEEEGIKGIITNHMRDTGSASLDQESFVSGKERAKETPHEFNPFAQLLMFKDAVHAVKEQLKHQGVTREQIEQTVKRFEFGDRQNVTFMKGVDKLFARRRVVLEARAKYSERFGERAGQELFKAAFSVPDTFGSVKLDDNDNCMTFVCGDPRDVTIVLANESRSEIFNELKSIPDEMIKEMIGEANETLPMGMFNPDLNLPIEGIGEVSAVIIINKSSAEEKGISVESVLAHELQHAENSLYTRPALERHANKAKQINLIADSIEDWGDKQKQESVLSLEIQLELLNARLEQVAGLIDALRAQMMSDTVEALIKEELLAFHAGGEKTQEIQEALPLYILEIRKIFAMAFSLIDKYVSKMSNELLAAAHINRTEVSARSIGDSLSMITGKFSVSGEKSDPLVKIRTDVAEKLSHFDQMTDQMLNEGITLLDEMVANDSANGSEIVKDMLPILISQPLQKWRSLFEKMKTADRIKK